MTAEIKVIIVPGLNAGMYLCPLLVRGEWMCRSLEKSLQEDAELRWPRAKGYTPCAYRDGSRLLQGPLLNPDTRQGMSCIPGAQKYWIKESV